MSPYRVAPLKPAPVRMSVWCTSVVREQHAKRSA